MSESDVAAVICCAILCEEDANAKTKKKRSCWTKDWILRRDMHGAYDHLVRELEIEDELSYQNFFRMGKESFQDLLGKVELKIKKQDTNMRECLPVGLKLAVTLRFLSSGDSFKSLSYLYRVPSNTICTFVPEVCQGIYEALQPVYAKVPSTQEEWNKIIHEFEDKWQFPNCFGAMDGKHFAVTAPAHSGSQFFNYKGYFSIIMLALVDANYKFTFVDVGANGRAGDAGIFSNSDLMRSIETNALNIPSPKPLPGRQEDTPHVIVGDEAFPLKTYLMKPFPQRNLPTHRRIYNYRLSRARRVSENAFGILITRFQVFQKPMRQKPDNAVKTIMAAVVLHNYLRSKVDKVYYVYSSQCDVEPDTTQVNQGIGLSRQGGNFSSSSARDVRDEFTDYFLTNGQVDWQWDKI